MGNVIANTKEIAALASINEVNRAFFEALTSRVKNSAETTVLQAMAIAKGERHEIVELFKRMEDLGLGHFWVGRRGGQSRFEWSVRLTEVGQVYAGEMEVVESASKDDLDEEPLDIVFDVVDHEFSLRPDFKVEIRLPTSLTQREAERLAAFVLTLPYE